MNHSEILFKFLSARARRFVQAVETEWNGYLHGSVAREGCLRRDAVRHRLTRFAYYKYNKAR